MSNSILVIGQLSRSAINGKIDTGVEVAVSIVANEVLMFLDIRSNFDVVSNGCTFDCDCKLLQPVEEARKFADLRLDVIGQSFGQFHVSSANCDEHVSILLFWRTIGHASATAAARTEPTCAQNRRLRRRDHARPSLEMLSPLNKSHADQQMKNHLGWHKGSPIDS